MRSRWPISLREQHARRAAGDYSHTLEAGEHGLDGRRAPGRRLGGVLRATTCIVVATTVALLASCALISMKMAHDSALGRLEIELAATTDSPCTHFKSDWFKVVSLPTKRHGMTSVRIVSVGSTVVQSGEILELAECMGKRIQRERHVTIGVRYQPLETWPFGRSREIALDGEQAVCVQHAVDQFKGKIDCDSN
jgi:hypothetical protein